MRQSIVTEQKARGRLLSMKTSNKKYFEQNYQEPPHLKKKKRRNSSLKMLSVKISGQQLKTFTKKLKLVSRKKKHGFK
jgi:hypothetical protein